MLKHIPFYASLLGRQMKSGRKSNNGMVLVYGAIEVHSMGDKGCIASNGRIAQETGLSAGTVANYISELNKSGWVKVNTKTVNGGIVRVNIEPLLTIATPSSTTDTLHTSVIPPSSGDDTPLHLGMNIDNNIDNKENTGITNVIGETPEKYGRDDINEMFDYWEARVGYAITSRRQPNRNACKNLLARYKDKGLKQLIDATAIAQSDQYAPRVSDFASMQSKLNELIAWGKRKSSNNKPKVAKI